MPWNGAGQYVLPPAFTPEANGNLVDPARYNGALSDIAGGLTAALARNGENVATANLKLGGFRITGLGVGVLGTDAVNLAQMDAAINNREIYDDGAWTLAGPIEDDGLWG